MAPNSEAPCALQALFLLVAAVAMGSYVDVFANHLCTSWVDMLEDEFDVPANQQLLVSNVPRRDGFALVESPSFRSNTSVKNFWTLLCDAPSGVVVDADSSYAGHCENESVYDAAHVGNMLSSRHSTRALMASITTISPMLRHCLSRLKLAPSPTPSLTTHPWPSEQAPLLSTISA
eukprot:1029452-Amphidinium_carterae.2